MKIQELAKQVFQIEASAITQLIHRIDEQFEYAVQLIANCSGRVIICGLGKSGLIGKKIAATLASTGTPSFFIHPTEAIHGDLGMIMEGDCFLSISNSGETDEILQVLPHVKYLNLPHITIVGNPTSTLAKHADVILNTHVEREASTLEAAPMASAIATLAMGDALATALIHIKDFQQKDFAQIHPGGSLGHRLITQVQDVMLSKELPFVAPHESIKDILVKMSAGMLGIVAVCNPDFSILGIITDGDLRRALNKFADQQFFSLCATDIMTKNPVTIQAHQSLTDAEMLMNKYRITSILVEQEEHLIGIIAKHHIK